MRNKLYKPLIQDNWLKIIAITLIAFGTPFLPGCSNSHSTQPNIILISIDTLRQDAVGIYNKKLTPTTTPNLDKFAEDSVRYNNAYAPMPFTPSSHMSMFTGTYPDVHQVHGTVLDTEKAGEKILSDKIKTLPEILKKLGYKTFGLYSVAWLKSGFGFGRGFDHYQQIPHSLNLATKISDIAINFLKNKNRSEESSAPFLLFLHYYDPHSDFSKKSPPYAVPTPFQITEYSKATEHFCTNDGKCATGFLIDANINGTKLPKKDLTLLQNLYHGGVRYVDSEIGRFLEELKRQKLYTNSLIIITSDHGEEFQEHGSLTHEQTYEESVRIPLIIKFPGSTQVGMKIDNFVELIDLLPTITSTIGITIPKQVQGKNLLPTSLNNLNNDKYLPLMQDKIRREVYAIRNERYKIIYNTKTMHSELYDLSQDPAENNNLAEEKKDIIQQLTTTLKKKLTSNKLLAKFYRQDNHTNKTNILGDAEKKRLKSLGYIQ